MLMTSKNISFDLYNNFIKKVLFLFYRWGNWDSEIKWLALVMIAEISAKLMPKLMSLNAIIYRYMEELLLFLKIHSRTAPLLYSCYVILYINP